MGALVKLRSLVLNGASSFTWPGAITQLTALEFLELSEGMKAVPDALITGGARLRTIDLGRCMALTAFPEVSGRASP